MRSDMYAKILKPFAMLGLFVLLVGLACSFGSSGETPASQPEQPQTTVAPAATDVPPTSAPAPTETPVESAAISKLQDVKRAIIQIESQGTFIDPEFGLVLNGAG